MKKIIDKNKVSSFKNKGINYHHYSSFCMKTKPNKLYFSSELKKLTNEIIYGPIGQQMKEEDPAKYYSLLNRSLPKKYQKPSYPIAPVNAYVPPQSKLSYEELQKQMDEERRIKKEKEEKALQIKREKEKEAERLRMHREAVARERRIIFPCNAHDNHRWTSIHSEAYQRKYNKKYEYY